MKIIKIYYHVKLFMPNHKQYGNSKIYVSIEFNIQKTK